MTFDLVWYVQGKQVKLRKRKKKKKKTKKDVQTCGLTSLLEGSCMKV